MTVLSNSDAEIRRELIDAGWEPHDIEQKIGEGWTMLEIRDLAKEQGFFEDEK